ncbi:MAG: mannose-1-phosphate guanylyltransferase/mannose-6-phosphate isomerase [Chromatiaceae bacterium]|nr:mannose-1-phosphate guanylyltransferase/mannose-6-phosphate isomerase [Chromatiaceae bacterium]
MRLQPVILSGGSGTRLWPLSREAYPKQFLPLTSEHTMLQETVRRLDGLDREHPRLGIGVADAVVVCNEGHRFLVAEQFRLIHREPAAIILEPEGRNTAPALTAAALVASREGQDPVLLVMPADHTMRDEAGFRQVVADGFTLAAQGHVVTFGIVPTKPETGYGYIRQGDAFPAPDLAGSAFGLRAFVEKPDAQTALAYLESGDYFWNSGLFMMRASVWLDLIQQYRPDIAAAAGRAVAQGESDGIFLRLDADSFHACPSDSIDYAVMEHLSEEKAAPGASALVLALAVGWSDVGAWSSLWEVRDQDEEGNVLDGDAFVHNAHNNLLVARHRMVAVIGVDGLVVVETPDAVLVVSKEHAQDVKAVTQHLQREQRRELRHHQRSHRPWGDFESIDHGERYQVKRLTVKPGETLSLQMHHHRAEHWIVVSGTARVTNEDRVFLLTENQSTYIPVGAKHRLENPGSLPLEIIEVQSGSYLGEDDIVRFEDVYKRNSKD